LSVLIEVINVIVRCETVEAKYPGGLAGYTRAVPNQSSCDDGFIARVGFMKPEDVGVWTSRLVEVGFVFQRPDGSFDEIAVVDQHTGPTLPCDWLGYGELFEPPVQFAYLLSAGEQGFTELFAPGGWEPSEESTTFVPNEERDRLQFIESRDGVSQYRDRETGSTQYIGEAFPPLHDQIP
jgi:hypothetical protein